MLERCGKRVGTRRNVGGKRRERKKEREKERKRKLSWREKSLFSSSLFLFCDERRGVYRFFFFRLNRKSRVRCVSRLVCELHENSRSCFLCGSNFFSLSLSPLSLSLSLASLSRARVSFNVENTIYFAPPKEKKTGEKRRREHALQTGYFSPTWKALVIQSRSRNVRGNPPRLTGNQGRFRVLF